MGRHDETAQLGKLLGEFRLVTVTGPPGMGKTRLAVQVASGLAATYANGAWVVDLAPIRDEHLVLPTLAKALKVGEVRGQDVLQTLLSYLADRHLLVVIDNCEHLLATCASLAEHLLASSPKVSLLLTSRESLGIADECLFTLGPLSVTESAVELFVDRAGAVDPDFSLGDVDADLVQEVCRLTDGIPLAIELVSARVGALGLADVVSNLHEMLTVVAVDQNGQDGRHHNMQAALDWSHRLLSEPERAVFRRLSAFTGGWTGEAAVEVCAGEPVDGDVLDHLKSLAAKSLVSVDTTGPLPRYRMLETIRLFAAERLAAAAEVEDVAARHRQWCVTLAEGAEAGLTGADQVAWLHRLDADHDNLRAALSCAVSEGHVEDGLRLAGDLALFWRLRGHLQEGHGQLTAALKLGAHAPSALRAKALWGHGLMTLMLGHGPDARAPLQEALELARQAADGRSEARCLLLLGNERVHNDSNEAIALLDRAAELARENNDTWCAGLAVGLIGRIHQVRGESATARQTVERCILEAGKANELQSLRFGLLVLGDLCIASRDFGEAKEHLEDALAIARQLGETYAESAALCSLGDVELNRDDFLHHGHERAEAHFDEALEVAKQAGAPDLVLLALRGQGSCARQRGDLVRARQRLNQAVDLGDEIGTPDEGVLVELGRVELAAGDAGAAMRLFERSAELSKNVGNIHVLVIALLEQGRLAEAEGNPRKARSLWTRALELALGIDDLHQVAAGLEAMANLAADAQRLEITTRLLGAAQALRGAQGASPHSFSKHEVILEAVGREEFKALWAEGSRLTAAQAVSYACRKSAGEQQPDKGPSLTKVERDVVALVSEGLTNAEVAERLFISSRTVGNHLSRIYARFGLRSRTELVNVTRDALREAEH